MNSIGVIAVKSLSLPATYESITVTRDAILVLDCEGVACGRNSDGQRFFKICLAWAWVLKIFTSLLANIAHKLE